MRWPPCSRRIGWKAATSRSRWARPRPRSMPCWRRRGRWGGAIIGFLIALPVGPAAALCIRRSITIGAVAGYMTGIGAALGDAVFGAVAAFGLSFVESFVARHEAWLRGIGGAVLVIMGWATM